MTNWMTAAGIALIAGGLATLIGFRRALWAGGGRRREGSSRAIDAPRRRELTAGAPAPARALPAARRAELTSAPSAAVPAAAVPAAGASAASAEAPAMGARAAKAARTARAAKPATAAKPAKRATAATAATAARTMQAAQSVQSAPMVLAQPDGADEDGAPRSFRGRRRRARVSGGAVVVEADDRRGNRGNRGDRAGLEDEPVGRFGLASIGLADDEADLADDEIGLGDDRSRGEMYEISGEISYDISGEIGLVEEEPEDADRDADGDERHHDARFDADDRFDPADAFDADDALGADEDEEMHAYADDEDEDDVADQADDFEDLQNAAEPGDDRVVEARVEEDRVEEDEPPHRRMARAVLERSRDVHPELAGVDAASVFARPSDRAEGWVRPNYDVPANEDENEEQAGDYWTPVPYADLDDAPYGWPDPVERLPLIPPDRTPAEAVEPTGALPPWPPAQPSGRIELPRNGSHERRRALTDDRWSDTDDDGRDGWERGAGEWSAALEPQRAYGPEDSDSWPVNAPEPKRRRGKKRRGDDSTHVIPAVLENEPRRRPRPRPDGDAHSTVYRSRHAAEPS